MESLGTTPRTYSFGGFDVKLQIGDGLFDFCVRYRGILEVRVRSSQDEPPVGARYWGQCNIPISKAKYVIFSLGAFKFSLFGINLGWNLLNAYVIDTTTFVQLTASDKVRLGVYDIDRRIV